ncbi:hypothetical protein FOZ61_008162 [Perkinsus olseni]|uniref:Uncharacterized protein n=1 Tax=Perkinsus olseni TaxID=32597 RepID=A0A7J6M5P9_PEROL|nr:hypothetical protein FOZ61_008162 [Perkinsus olseni]KAF4666837.1 hypothetical protein FOL46_002836 [Perkinsus olseni]
MLFCLSYLLLGVLAGGYTVAEVKEKFDAYKKRFGHDFGDDDDYRMAVFDDNLRYIDIENAKGLSYTLKIGPFAHLTNAEFKETMFGKSSRFSSQRPLGTAANMEEFSGSTEELPKSVNYVAKGWVTGVKDQTNCGSCWAFSATGALEGLHKNVSGELVSLSEEELIDCSRDWQLESFRYVEDHGLGAEKDYPYTSICPNFSPGCIPPTFPCTRNAKKDVIKSHSISHINMKPKSKSSLLAAVARIGPVSVALDGMSEAFQHYGKGVLDSGCSLATNHGVLAVGYDMGTDKPYYLVKNSWGTGWGEKGYIKIAIDDSAEGVCGILLDPSYPIPA